MNKFERLIAKASTEANKSTFDRARIGAIIIKGDRIISSGYNQIRKSRLKSDHFEGSLHAEMDAIMKVIKTGRIKDLSGATLIVSRVMKNGTLGLAMPCEDCFRVIQSMRIKKVIFSTDDGYSEIKI